MISKALLEKVLGVDLDLADYIGHKIVGNNLEIKFDNNSYEMLNVYGLAVECKKWARGKGFIISSSVTKSLKGFVHLKRKGGKPYPYRANTEHEAIFKACEWILSEQ